MLSSECCSSEHTCAWIVACYQPEMDIQLTCAEPLLSDSQLDNVLFASVTAGSMFSTPDSWTVAHAGGFNYVAAMSVPVSADVRELLWLFLTIF